MGGRPHSGNHSQLRGCDQQLRSVSLFPLVILRLSSVLLRMIPHSWHSLVTIPCLDHYRKRALLAAARATSEDRADKHPQELAQINDEMIYNELKNSDINMGRWTAEDPSLRAVQRWVRSRRG